MWLWNYNLLELHGLRHLNKIKYCQLTVFPESLAILVLTSTEHGEQLEQLLIGLAGGRGFAAQRLVSGAKGSPTLFTSETDILRINYNFEISEFHRIHLVFNYPY